MLYNRINSFIILDEDDYIHCFHFNPFSSLKRKGVIDFSENGLN
jgi:hypothetical protein